MNIWGYITEKKKAHVFAVGPYLGTVDRSICHHILPDKPPYRCHMTHLRAMAFLQAVNTKSSWTASY